MMSAGLNMDLGPLTKDQGHQEKEACGQITYKTSERVITPINRSPKCNLVGLGDFKTFKEQVTPQG
jgi:hypothetical protein